MKPSRIAFLIGLLVLSFFVYASIDLNKNPGKIGTIMALDLNARTIQIEQMDYALSDKIVVYNADAILADQLLLQPGQKIEYWKGEGRLNPQLPPQTISQIRILSPITQVPS